MKYILWTYTAFGFGHGWQPSQSDTIPDGAVSVSYFDPDTAIRSKVYAVTMTPAPGGPA